MNNTNQNTGAARTWAKEQLGRIPISDEKRLELTVHLVTGLLAAKSEAYIEHNGDVWKITSTEVANYYGPDNGNEYVLNIVSDADTILLEIEHEILASAKLYARS